MTTPFHTTPSGPSALSHRASALQASQIREIAELGMGQPDVIPLWFGEGAWPSSQISVEAAIVALRNGDHFYQPNSGKPSLRTAIADYMRRIYDLSIDVPRITVTASAMQGLALVAQAIVSPGDRVVMLEPSWPNIAQAFRIAGAEIHTEALVPKGGRWFLDVDRFLAALTPGTKAVVLNSPSNPTGWTMNAGDQRSLLDHCRKQGIWIVTDDVYSRLYLRAAFAPTFLSISEPDDRVISINSFSKAWSMTGWRLGWIVAPAFLEGPLAMLTEFNIAGPAGFVQAAGEACLRDGERDVAELRAKLTDAYAIAARRLSTMDRIAFIEPEGAFYCFFQIDGVEDSVAFAKRILRDAKLGLAPGVAFGSVGEGYMRLCYAQPPDVLEEAFNRLETFLGSHRSMRR